MDNSKALAFLSIFSHATVSLMLYRSPKNHVSLSPRVRHTRSKRSFPFHFTYRTKQPDISTSWSLLAGKFPSPSLPKFDLITFHHELKLPVQSLSCSPHPAEACDREYQTSKPFLERFHLKTWGDSRCNSRLVWEILRNGKTRHVMQQSLTGTDVHFCPYSHEKGTSKTYHLHSCHHTVPHHTEKIETLNIKLLYVITNNMKPVLF